MVSTADRAQTSRTAGAPIVVLLHGYMGLAADLSPFAASLGVDADFVVPHGLVDLAPQGRRGRAWWPTDADARARAVAAGPRDLSAYHPEGLDEARAWLGSYALELIRDRGPRPLVVGGFSQGAMLACDFVLRTECDVAGLVMFSGARIAASTWAPLYARRAGLPTFISHGRSDDDLAFSAAEALSADLTNSGWDVTFCPFDGGHAIPLLAWRAFKRWIQALPRSS